MGEGTLSPAFTPRVSATHTHTHTHAQANTY